MLGTRLMHLQMVTLPSAAHCTDGILIAIVGTLIAIVISQSATITRAEAMGLVSLTVPTTTTTQPRLPTITAAMTTVPTATMAARDTPHQRDTTSTALATTAHQKGTESINMTTIARCTSQSGTRWVPWFKL